MRGCILTYFRFKKKTFLSSGISMEGTLLSASAVFHSGDVYLCITVCVKRERERERERESTGHLRTTNERLTSISKCTFQYSYVNTCSNQIDKISPDTNIKQTVHTKTSCPKGRPGMSVLSPVWNLRAVI